MNFKRHAASPSVLPAMLLVLLFGVFLFPAPGDFSRKGIYSIDSFASMVAIANPESYPPETYDNKATRHILEVALTYRRPPPIPRLLPAPAPHNKFASTQPRAPPLA